jgi:opacity protein-like surface antigen
MNVRKNNAECHALVSCQRAGTTPGAGRSHLAHTPENSNRRKFLMVRKIGLSLVLCLLFGFSAFAQDSKADAYVGFQYTRFNSQGVTNMTGGVGQFAYYPSSWLGIVGEVSGASDTGGRGSAMYTFMGGPRATLRHGRFEPYAQVLIGGSRFNSSVQGVGRVSTNSFAAAVGGGVDLKVVNHFAIRLIQVDYLFTHFSGLTQNNLRLSSGFVFRF